MAEIKSLNEINEVLFEFDPEKYPLVLKNRRNYSLFMTKELEKQTVQDILNIASEISIYNLVTMTLLLTVYLYTYDNEKFTCGPNRNRSPNDILRILWGYGFKINPIKVLKILSKLTSSEIIGMFYCNDIYKIICYNETINFGNYPGLSYKQQYYLLKEKDITQFFNKEYYLEDESVFTPQHPLGTHNFYPCDWENLNEEMPIRFYNTSINPIDMIVMKWNE